ncbi:GmrSD restriction endonuclease domain-containing protein [Paenibacillus cineris]
MLGNLTIITQAQNASIRDSDWATKKNGKCDKGRTKKIYRRNPNF